MQRAFQDRKARFIMLALIKYEVKFEEGSKAESKTFEHYAEAEAYSKAMFSTHKAKHAYIEIEFNEFDEIMQNTIVDGSDLFHMLFE